jgi:hypothetical protein
VFVGSPSATKYALFSVLQILLPLLFRVIYSPIADRCSGLPHPSGVVIRTGRRQSPRLAFGVMFGEFVSASETELFRPDMGKAGIKFDAQVIVDGSWARQA